MTGTIQKPERRALAFGTLSCCCAAFALVIWIKMRVVTAVPRTAYAEPERREIAPPRSDPTVLAGDAEGTHERLVGDAVRGE